MRYVTALLVITIGAALLVPPPANAEDLALCREGLSAAKSGKLDDALKFYDQCFSRGKLTPMNRAQWRYRRANVYLVKGRIQDAIRDYSEAIRLKPDFGLAYGSRGLAYEANGRKKEAMSDFKKAELLGLKANWLKDKLGTVNVPELKSTAPSGYLGQTQ